MHAFGTVCFAFKSKHYRDAKFKRGNTLAQRGLRGRLVGYLDSGGAIEMRGYLILIENEGNESYLSRTRWVRFCPDIKMTPLKGEPSVLEHNELEYELANEDNDDDYEDNDAFVPKDGDGDDVGDENPENEIFEKDLEPHITRNLRDKKEVKSRFWWCN
jgi:hypothetical protein